MLPEAPAERHAEIAAGFGDRVRGTTDWSALAPVPDWTARDVVRHLVTWFPAFLADGGVSLSSDPPAPSVDEDPVAAWERHTASVQALFGSDQPFSHPRIGSMPLDQAIAMFYTADVFMHTWDLARATGQDETLDADLCAEMLAGMTPMEEVLRGSGHYGPRVDVPDDADAQTRLLGFIGRDPDWRA